MVTLQHPPKRPPLPTLPTPLSLLTCEKGVTSPSWYMLSSRTTCGALPTVRAIWSIHISVNIKPWRERERRAWRRAGHARQATHVRSCVPCHACPTPHVRCHMSDTTCQTPHVRCHMSDTTCQMPHVRHHMSGTACQMPHVRHHISDAACQTPHVRHHMSDTTCHATHVMPCVSRKCKCTATQVPPTAIPAATPQPT